MGKHIIQELISRHSRTSTIEVRFFLLLLLCFCLEQLRIHGLRVPILLFTFRWLDLFRHFFLLGLFTTSIKFFLLLFFILIIHFVVHSSVVVLEEGRVKFKERLSTQNVLASASLLCFFSQFLFEFLLLSFCFPLLPLVEGLQSDLSEAL